jgi:hypothetical protein
MGSLTDFGFLVFIFGILVIILRYQGSKDFLYNDIHKMEHKNNNPYGGKCPKQDTS